MLSEVCLELRESGKERDVCRACPCGRLKLIRESARSRHNTVGRFVFPDHHGDRVGNRTEAGVCRWSEATIDS